MKWRKQDEEFLKKYYPKRIPLEKMAKEINKTSKALQRKAQRMGLSRPNYKFNVVQKQPRRKIDKRYYENNKLKVYQRKMLRRKKLKEEMVNLLGGKCQKCGYKKCVAALEFHHNKEDKEGSVGNMLKNESRHKLLKEVKKCILLCANCHRELHYQGSVV